VDTIEHIISPNWLNDHLFDDDLVILEVGQKKNEVGLDLDNHSISGSIKVNLGSDFGDPNGQFPNTFPTVTQFESTCNRFGISNESKVIIVDRLGIYSSPRIWFLFKAMGHENVAVLDGGLPAWINEGFEVVDLPNVFIEKGNYCARLDPQIVKGIEDITENIESSNSILIDARSSDRYFGIVPEPRAGIPSGNIPNSINIPFKSLLDDYKYKSVRELRLIFDEHNFGDKPLIFTCGSGVTACIIMLATELVNSNDKSIYDGSWTEWASIMKK
jgi:thiosulfate/3-mercaptopyruvate sulfurtransferase